MTNKSYITYNAVFAFCCHCQKEMASLDSSVMMMREVKTIVWWSTGHFQFFKPDTPIHRAQNLTESRKCASLVCYPQNEGTGSTLSNADLWVFSQKVIWCLFWWSQTASPSYTRRQTLSCPTGYGIYFDHVVRLQHLEVKLDKTCLGQRTQAGRIQRYKVRKQRAGGKGCRHNGSHCQQMNSHKP